MIPFDHTVRVYRADRSEDSLGDPAPAYAPRTTAPTYPNARPDQSWSGATDDAGPGTEQQSSRTWFLSPDLTVEETDVLHVTAGPEAGTVDAPKHLRVLGVTRPTNPLRVHHIEVNVTSAEGVIL